MIRKIRSHLFNIAFYLWSGFMALIMLPTLLLPRRVCVFFQHQWARGAMFLLRHIAGIGYEIRGRENLPDEQVLIASKHQSAWDTIIWHAVADDPAIVLKKELLYIPLYGWYALKAKMLPVDRAAHAKALRQMLRDARAIAATGRNIVIFPEGTRSSPDKPNPYLPGVAALYRELKLPVVPVAVNSGLYWPRRKIDKCPGTIVLQYLEPIPPGLPRREFMQILESRIEEATRALIAEGREKMPD